MADLSKYEALQAENGSLPQPLYTTDVVLQARATLEATVLGPMH